MKKSQEVILPRPVLPLKNFQRTRVLSEYGSSSETVTKNTGAILTTYILSNLSCKKLADEPQSMVKKETDEKSAILKDVFEKFRQAQEEEKSQFSFMNEEMREDDPPVSLEANLR